MPDPAVDAAQRVCEANEDLVHVEPYAALEAAAREALAPIRELHTSRWSCGNPRHTNPEYGCPECATACAECGDYWPCDTARLVYRKDELT